MLNSKVEEYIKEVEYIHKYDCITICIAKTIHGFYLAGTSFCDTDTNEFSKEKGECYSYKDVLRQLEHMIGFYEKIERSKEDFVENQIN
jgi:hypothetical protein